VANQISVKKIENISSLNKALYDNYICLVALSKVLRLSK